MLYLSLVGLGLYLYLGSLIAPGVGRISKQKAGL
jgi:hypothetical protein